MNDVGFVYHDQAEDDKALVTITTVVVNLQFESTHKWEACPFKEVAYLKDLHRHMFHICCKKQVAHSDRDIEIIMMKHSILKYLKSKYPESLGPMSCEMLAEELVSHFGLSYCSVLEDGENGAEVVVAGRC